MKLLHPCIFVSLSIIIIVVNQIQTSFCAEDEKFINCSTAFDCANLKHLPYPFWGSNRPQYCGHPAFELKCSEKIAEISIMSESYKVLEVSDSSHSLKVVRNDYSNNACPTHLMNNTIDGIHFNYRSDSKNLTLLYDCPSPAYSYSLPYSSLENQFNCSINGTEMVNYFFLENLVALGSFSESIDACKSKVIVPILESESRNIETNSTLENLKAALSSGFGLVWEANNSLCDGCQLSGGLCGSDSTSLEFTCYCEKGSFPYTCGSGSSLKHSWLTIAIGGSIGCIGIVIIAIGIIYSRKRCPRLRHWMIIRKRPTFQDYRVEMCMRTYGSLAPRQYSFSEVKMMTNSFQHKLGQGGYGVVYKASLSDDRLAAVKVINEIKGSGEEFVNEVASISQTSHVNIVTLLGFCYEGTKRALIYEYMPNGSLDKFIQKRGTPETVCSLEWKIMYQIAIGIARGLEYLHQGCNRKILHLDIKPQNILLDANFCPKISDFGLSKVCQKRESIVSILGIRGTIGYIAPEVFSRTFGRVSHKSDVYSYGMLIIEMVGGRKNFDNKGSNTSEMYFPDWIYKDLEEDNTNTSHVIGEENEMVRKMTLIGLWCVQINPSNRPTMSKVIEMLKGSIELLPFPPKPFLGSPTRPPLQFSDESSIIMLETNSTTNLEKDEITPILG